MKMKITDMGNLTFNQVKRFAKKHKIPYKSGQQKNGERIIDFLEAGLIFAEIEGASLQLAEFEQEQQ